MSSALKDQTQDAMKTAMKGGDKARLAVIRLMLSEMKQVEVDERRVVFAAVDLGFHAIAAAGPVEVIGALAEQGTAVRVPHGLE